MVFIILLFCLFFAQPVFAESSIKINGYSATDQEYVELINNSSSDINLDGWIIRDDNSYTTDDIFLTATDIISANSSKQFINKNDSTWLNNDKDIIYLYDNSGTLIDKLSYPIPTNTPIPPTSTPILTPTNTPTPDPTIVNPTSGIKLTEFMPYSDPEWIELYNANDYPVKLVSWKLEDKDSNTRNINSLTINAKSYAIFEYSPFFDNNKAETVILRNQDNTVISQMSYSSGLRTVDRSWSLINNNWCQSSITKGYENVTSCYITPSNTPTPSATPTPDPNTDTSKYTSTATESAIIEPKSESSFLAPTDAAPTSTVTSGLILGDGDTTNTTKKRNYLPLILIIGGGILLISPTVIAKIKSKK